LFRNLLQRASRPVLAVYCPCAWRLVSESISQSAKWEASQISQT